MTRNPKGPGRAEIVAAARELVGVKLFHQGRTAAGGVDCLGVILVAGEASGALPGGLVIPDYGRLPNPHRLVANMDAAAIRLVDHDALSFEPKTPPARQAQGEYDDGDILGMSWGLRGAPMHLGIATTFQGRRMIVQANPGLQRVTEAGFAGAWSGAFCVAWRFPNLVV